MIEWEELRDKDFANWKRVRSIIEHENILINQRLSWLFASQTILVSVCAIILSDFVKADVENSVLPIGYGTLIVVVLGFVGCYMCLSVAVLLNAAIRQLRETTLWWEKNQVTPENNPVLHDFKERNVLSLLNVENIPFFFFFVWVVLGFMPIYFLLPQVAGISSSSVDIWIIPIALFVGAIISKLFQNAILTWRKEL